MIHCLSLVSFPFLLRSCICCRSLIRQSHDGGKLFWVHRGENQLLEHIQSQVFNKLKGGSKWEFIAIDSANAPQGMRGAEMLCRNDVFTAAISSLPEALEQQERLDRGAVICGNDGFVFSVDKQLREALVGAVCSTNSVL